MLDFFFEKSVPYFVISYTIASALKKYLVQFDEPLIPFNNYESFLQVARKIATTSKTTTTNNNNILLSQSFAGMPSNSKATTPSGEFLSKKERIEEFRELLKAIPEQNYKVLKYILAHLTKVEQNASVNKMNSNNLAIVFGPICFRYKESSKNKDPMKILTDAPAISSCVHTFITDYEYIFAGKEFVDDPSPIIPVIDSLKTLDEASAEGRRSKRSSVNTPTYHSRNVSTEPLSDQDDPSKKKNSLTINHFTSRGSRTNSRASCSMVDLPKILSQTLEDGDSAMINNSIAPSVFDKLVAVDQQRQ